MRPHWSLGILHLKKRRWFSCSSSLFQQKSNVLWNRKRGKYLLPIYQSRFTKRMLCFFTFSPQRQNQIQLERKVFGGAEGGGKWPLPCISLSLQKGSKTTLLCKGSTLENSGQCHKETKKRVDNFLPMCPRPSVKWGFILFIGVHRGTCLYMYDMYVL